MKTSDELTVEINNLIEIERTLPVLDRWEHFCNNVGPLMEERELAHALEKQKQYSEKPSKWFLGTIG